MPVIIANKHSANVKMTGRDFAVGMAIVFLVATSGMAIALQGWRSRIPDVQDEILAIDGARDLLAHGHIPYRGGITNYSSYFPPGLAWLVVPGLLVFSDPRLFEIPGSALLYVGTLVGIFLLARTYFGSRCAHLSVALYGISELALHHASFLQARGHPFFYVWMAYCMSGWVRRKDPKFLTAAILIWATGMYIHMELAPGVFIIPAIWFLYRPPIRFRGVALAGALQLLIWYPYLRFEMTRHFADIRSQVLLEDLRRPNFRDAWCVPTRTLRQWERVSGELDVPSDSGAQNLMTSFATALGRRCLAFAQGLLSNFGALIFGGRFVLLTSTLAGLAFFTVTRSSVSVQGIEPIWYRRIQGRRFTYFGFGLLLVAAVSNELIAPLLAPDGRLEPGTISELRLFEVLMSLVAVALLIRRSIFSALDRLLCTVPRTKSDPLILVISVVVPWVILSCVVEPGRVDRFIGVWPLQLIILLGFSDGVFPQTKAATVGRWTALTLITSVIVWNPIVTSGAAGWLRNGWSGPDSALIPAAEYVAGILNSEGQNRSSIGYRLFIPGAHAASTDVDARYKVGVQFDYLLEYRHGILNSDQCAEGLSPHDEYRIVEERPSGPEETYYFDLPQDFRFKLLHSVGQYQIYTRD